MRLADAAHLLAETDRCDQRPPRIVRVLRKPVLAAAGQHFLNLVDPRLDLGNVLARELFHLRPPGRDAIVTLRRGPSVWSIRRHRECRAGSRRYPGKHQLLPMAKIATPRSEEHTSELQSLMRNSYAVF